MHLMTLRSRQSGDSEMDPAQSEPSGTPIAGPSGTPTPGIVIPEAPTLDNLVTDEAYTELL